MLKEMSSSLEIAHTEGSELAVNCGHTKYFNRALSALDRNSRVSSTVSYKTLPVSVLGRRLEECAVEDEWVKGAETNLFKNRTPPLHGVHSLELRQDTRNCVTFAHIGYI